MIKSIIHKGVVVTGIIITRIESKIYSFITQNYLFLREDSSYILREDGTKIMREDG